MVKNPPASEGDERGTSLTPGSGRSPGEGNGNPLQYSCLESPKDRGAWGATVHGVTKSQTQLSSYRTVLDAINTSSASYETHLGVFAPAMY